MLGTKQHCNILDTSGFHAKALTLSREAGSSEIVISWDDLGASKVEAEHLSCLVENQCHECMVEAYDLINQGVETKVQVKMVASASSSSLEEELLQTPNIDTLKSDAVQKLPDEFSRVLAQLGRQSVKQTSKSDQSLKSSGSSAEEGDSAHSGPISDDSNESSLYEPSEGNSEEEDSSYFRKK